MSKFKSQARIVPVEEAVGMVLSHDITEIRPGEFKGAAFKKGHVLCAQDIPRLRRAGKEHVYALDLDPDEVHEDEAASALGLALCGEGVRPAGPPAEGKVSLVAAVPGLLRVDREALLRFNLVPDVCCASRHDDSMVAAGETVAATRAIPLLLSRARFEEALSSAAGGVFSILPIPSLEVGLVVTGTEVYRGLIEDRFAPVIREKLERFGCRLRPPVFAPDDREEIAAAIRTHLEAGVGLVVVAGGMSVDPDDVSRQAILAVGARDVVYGTPVLPGAMFLWGRLGQVPVIGVPACTIFYRATVLDLVLPRVLLGETISREYLAGLGHGGLCLNCPDCRYPVCPFGK